MDINTNGICDFGEVEGCTDAMACNYNPGATLDSGMCAYPEQFYDCDENCLSDSDGDACAMNWKHPVALLSLPQL